MAAKLAAFGETKKPVKKEETPSAPTTPKASEVKPVLDARVKTLAKGERRRRVQLGHPVTHDVSL